MNRQFDKITAVYTRIDYPGDIQCIEEQKRTVQRYAEEQGFTNIFHYSDNGYTGIHNNRPAFQQMLRDMEDGNLVRIIVKDLGRLFRGYIDNAEFLNKTLPRYGVELYAVWDELYVPTGFCDLITQAWRKERKGGQVR